MLAAELLSEIKVRRIRKVQDIHPELERMPLREVEVLRDAEIGVFVSGAVESTDGAVAKRSCRRSRYGSWIQEADTAVREEGHGHMRGDPLTQFGRVENPPVPDVSLLAKTVCAKPEWNTKLELTRQPPMT